MGVRGFTTYMSHRSHLFLEDFQLKNCYLILDGSGIAIHLYQWCTRANDCFGGDYDNYANIVHKFFSLLAKCNITPIILFDGGYENRKLKTVFSRMKNRIGAIKRLNTATEGSICVYPLFIKELFQDIALDLKVKCIRNDYESDSEIACLARNLNCPILGYDSDFYFFDTLYIPFDKFEMKTLYTYNKDSRRQEHYVPCSVYNVDNFLRYFGGLDKIKLPLLPVLLGNDYVKKSLFSAFYHNMKIQKGKSENEQQRLIKTVIYWLRHETLDTAISKILGRFKEKKRKFITFKLNSAMRGYLQVNSTLTEYLDIHEQSSICRKKEHNIDIMNIKPTIEDESECSSNADTTLESEDSNEEEINEIMNDDEEIISIKPRKIEDSLEESSCFSDKYRRCLLPQCFVDISIRHTYFFLSQVEDYSEPHSHSICLNIVNCIHKILTQPCCNKLICVARKGQKSVTREAQAEYSKNLPSLQEIQSFDSPNCRKYFLEILNVRENYLDFLNLFPPNWHLFLISLYYWKANSRKDVDTSFIYSLILCSIVLNIVDGQVGFCRSPKTFYKKYSDRLKQTDDMKEEPAKSIISSFENINYNESLQVLKILLHYFHVDPKMSGNSRLYDVTIVSQFSQFQSCLLHIKYLNSLFNFPFENIIVSKFFTGTFLYNLVTNFRKRSNLKSYINIWLKDCTAFLQSFHLIVQIIEESFGVLCESEAKKTRKRRRKPKIKSETNYIKEPVVEEDIFIDEENKYSLLQNVNF